MEKAADREKLNSTLNSHLNTIHETLQVLNQKLPSTLEKSNWNDVVQMAEQISKQATVVGIIWTGDKPEVSKLVENMDGYFNSLQGFLLLSHGSTVGAGPTLSSNVHASVKQVVDCSFMLWKECVASYGSRSKDRKLTIPQLVGSIWDACSAIKKTPSTNITAIGRAVTQVAISVKDVLREMKELKPSASDIPCDNESDHDDDDDGDDIDTDLSPEEMKIAQSAIVVISETLALIKELLRSITALNKQESSQNNLDVVDSLERLLKLCQDIGVQIDELGACLYPPQEALAIKTSSEKICTSIDKMQAEMGKILVNSEAFVQACSTLRSSLRQLEMSTTQPSTNDDFPLLPSEREQYLERSLTQYGVHHSLVMQGYIPRSGPHPWFYTDPNAPYGGYPGILFEGTGINQDEWCSRFGQLWRDVPDISDHGNVGGGQDDDGIDDDGNE